MLIMKLKLDANQEMAEATKRIKQIKKQFKQNGMDITIIPLAANEDFTIETIGI